MPPSLSLFKDDSLVVIPFLFLLILFNPLIEESYYKDKFLL